MVERGYRPCGRGKVIEHKRKGSVEIEVIPLDDQPFQTGESISDIFTLEVQGEDASRKPYGAKIDTSKSITASWLSTDANRMTAPDVRRGDIVELYTFYDTQQYYWKEAESNSKRRRMEQVTHRYSATDDESTKELDDNNSIKIDLNGELGTYTINLPKIGKAKVSQTIQFDSQNGRIVITDSNENFIQLEEQGKITIANSKGSYRQFDLEEIHDVAPEAITHGTKKYTINCTTYDLNATTSVQFTTPKFNCTGPSTFGSTVHVTTQLTSPSIDTGTLLASSINSGPIVCAGISFGGSGGTGGAAPGSGGGSGGGGSGGSGGGGSGGTTNNSHMDSEEVYLEHPRQEFKADEFTVDSNDIKLGSNVQLDASKSTIGGFDISDDEITKDSVTISGSSVDIGDTKVDSNGLEVGTSKLTGSSIQVEELKVTGMSDIQVEEFKLRAGTLDIDENTLTSLATLLKPILDTL